MGEKNIKVLLVEDEEAIREMVSFTLTRAGFEVTEAADAGAAQTCIAQQLPDIVLLDWMLPGISGIDLARRWRQDSRTQHVPIMMLTARGEEEDKLRGFDIGVDDYMTKPFSTQELVARIKAILRRHSKDDAESVLVAEKLKLDTVGHRVTAGDVSLNLGPTEYRLLQFFMAHPERVFSRSQLLDQVWGDDVYIEERTVDVHIRRLRKLLEPHGCAEFVQTVRGSGYRFSQQV
ncbi:MAG: phosphate regulon transcriptional regulator PhoB [Gammaproteobacteria bacterium]